VHQRHVRSTVDGNVGPPHDLEKPQDVRSPALQALVPGDGGDAQNLDLGRLQREEKRHAVITRRKDEVGVEDDPVRLGGGVSLWAMARGMKEKEMDTIAGFIDKVIMNIEKPAAFAQVNADVQRLCESFPLYPEMTGR